jgi:heptosyltransferase III
LKKPKKILIIIQRSNGDVFLSLALINALYNNLHSPQIDLLVNDDTIAIAKLLPKINFIHTFSYKKKHEERWGQEKNLIKNIYRQYDLSINLTASDRSVIYSILASNNSISAIEKENYKSWWKKILLRHHYYFDTSKHILLNNLEPLRFLKIEQEAFLNAPNASKEAMDNVQKKLSILGISDFIIFHPSAQYKYKIYPQYLRDKLLSLLSNLGISIIVTGTNNKIDTEIKNTLPCVPNVVDLIGETSLEECFALSSLSQAYIGMDTLNMHIAAAQNKHIFAIFGPTKLSMWAPWSNQLEVSATDDMAIQTYDNVTIFQADMPCVACGNSGCDNHGKSDCLYNISPELIFKAIEDWYKKITL